MMEESISRPLPGLLTPICEVESNSYSKSSMLMTFVPVGLPQGVPNVIPKDIAYNMHLVFVETNAHKAKIYWDPMNNFVIKVEDHYSNLR